MVRRRSSLHWLFIAIILLFSLNKLWGHAIILESNPQMNSVVTGPQLEIRLRFNARVDGSRSKLTLISRDRVSRAIKLSQQQSPDSLLASISNLAPGKYQLHWQVLASDGHITQGDIPFSVVVP